ncbi:uncharacterized protein M421DRAFT_416321 [Didymella exigua CBS 183.55]|uniref:DUF6594 domain-containing protein n=1 Tax=Didymella exigua CBS 183.55 TaxID=1150837 RepID=A0A6A5S0A1_9PLEO|nr:uncharacterized protein M421DRAFT_416321 [Didymella exigua CBS 183.55]KAF1932708.1 hypothetical protein M421DRAFT_416321 [Didymella exigua CBS 183.55]
MSGPPQPDDITSTFRKAWITSTADNNLTLHGFRRFKTTHLLNLRFLEDEIAEMDHVLYQAGLSLNLSPSSDDRLGLGHCRRDAKVAKIDETITQEFIQKLRCLLKEYDAALAAFNNIMTMETFSLLDDEKQSSLRTDLSLYEIHKTRLLRVDLGTRARTDPFQRWLHRHLRAFRYWRLLRKKRYDTEGLGPVPKKDHTWSYQNTILIAEIIGRVATAALAAVFLIAPLAILSYQSSKNIQLAVISVCILILSFLVSLFLKVSSFEMMAVAAAYAAVLSVFVSNVPAG